MQPIGKFNEDTQEEPHMMAPPQDMSLEEMEEGIVYAIPAFVAKVGSELAVVGLGGALYQPDAVIPEEGMEAEGEEEEMEEEEDEEPAMADMGFLQSVFQHRKQSY